MTSDELRELRLPAELCKSAEQRFGARFGGLEQFLTFVLQELLRDDAAQMDQAEQRIIEERLKDLGYI
jgi:hypothetical protein